MYTSAYLCPLIVAIQKIDITQFLELSALYPVLDVRSPGEYGHAHIPGAYGLPLFSDEERAAVGTAYKQESREAAVKLGLVYFGGKMRGMVEEVENLIANWQLAKENESRKLSEKKDKGLAVGARLPAEKKSLPIAHCLLVHCWRGGMRSAGVAWLLDLYGFKVYTLIGGYKAYRKWALALFEKEYPFQIVGGYTGSGKTLVLKELEKQGQAVIDLEGLASHKGSAFGAMGEGKQPGQEMFENLLAEKLRDMVHNPPTNIWLEDESQRIGNLRIPMPLWNTMRKSRVCFLDIPFEQRLNYLAEEYGKFEAEKLVNAIIRIKKRLGGLETKNAINHLLENNITESFRILLAYYDKWYHKGLHNRDNVSALLNKISCPGVDTEANTKKLLSCSVPANC